MAVPQVCVHFSLLELEAQSGAELELPSINAFASKVDCSLAGCDLAEIATVAAAGCARREAAATGNGVIEMGRIREVEGLSAELKVEAL